MASRWAGRSSPLTPSAPERANTSSSSAARKPASRFIRRSPRSTPASSASSITGTWNRTDMQIARVVGTVVATQKHRKFEGAKLLLVQPLNPDDTARGAALLAIDGVGAGVTEKVL